ncbi:peptide deformylase [Endothiovibrio diazotrophicus]
MAILQILTVPDPRLKQVSERVERFDDEFRRRLADLEETRLAGPGAVGIAAPQVGWFQRVAIVDVSGHKKVKKHHGRMVLVNPEIVEYEGWQKGREGCLSVPEYTGNVMRASAIVLEALDEHGEPQRYEMEGFEARAVQHELDHLDGIVFLDRLVSRRSDLFQRKVYQ